jgi:hypothetical protein
LWSVGSQKVERHLACSLFGKYRDGFASARNKI